MKSGMKPAPQVVPAAHVQLTLPIQGVLQDVKHAFYGLCINAGKQVLAAMMEADRVALCGPKGVPDGDRRSLRGGSTLSTVVLGGQRISVRRPRARAVDAGELELPSFAWAAGADPLEAATMAAIAAGASIRRYATTLEPLPYPERVRSVSRSATSRRFVALSQEQLARWLSRSLDKLDWPVVMIDGDHFHERVILVAQGHRRDLRGHSAHPALPGAQAAQRDRAPAQGAARQRGPRHARGLGRCRRRTGEEALAAPGQRIAGQASGCRVQPARRTRGDTDCADSKHHRGVVPHAAHHQPDREPQRLDRALHAQCQAMARRADDPAMGRQRA